MGTLKASNNSIDFTGPLAVTKMMCQGEGEQVFLDTMKKVNRYDITDNNTLTFIADDIAVMRFRKK